MIKKLLKCSVCKKNFKYKGKGRPAKSCKKCQGK